MVTSYYISKLTNAAKKTDVMEYYSQLLQNDLKCTVYETPCRICLREGTIPFTGRNSIDISEFLKLTCNIIVNEEDDKISNYLCKVCYDFLYITSLFKKVAVRSEEFLALRETAVAPEILSEYENYDVQLDKECSDEDNATYERMEKKEQSKVTCRVCKRMVNKSYYKDHLTMHDPNHKKYVCDVCGMSFRLRCALHNHSQRHRTDFAFKCQLCPYKGNYKELLKTHMKTHTADYRYMCSECPARFLFKSNLNSHMRKHNEPVYKCDRCKRAFHTKLRLDRHIESDHMGIKNHVCNACGKAFGHRSAMMKHQLHVHKRQKMLSGRMPAYLKAEIKIT